MERRRIVLPEIERFYSRTLHDSIPEYEPIRIAHAIVTRGGYTLRMSGYPAIGPDGVIGKGDMRAQTLQALEYVKRNARTPEAQTAVLDALRFKCNVLWAQLDALHHADVTPGFIPPGAFVPADRQ